MQRNVAVLGTPSGLAILMTVIGQDPRTQVHCLIQVPHGTTGVSQAQLGRKFLVNKCTYKQSVRVEAPVHGQCCQGVVCHKYKTKPYLLLGQYCCLCI